jgi:hypothetical protein
MSISDFINKIKSYNINIDKINIMYSLVIIGVGISAFGLGRLSVESNSSKDTDIAITENQLSNISPLNSANGESISSSGKKIYVASKNGKLYYKPSCAGAKRIASKNEIWFSTAIEAEKSGYTLASSCK